MLKRVGFRLLLPTVNLAAFVAIFALTTSPPEDRLWRWTAENPFYPLLSIPRLAAISINAPACIIATVIIEIAGVSNLKFADWLVPTMCPLIALIWYFAGRWVDRRLKWIPVTPRKGWPAFLYVAAVAVGVLLIADAYSAVYFFRGGITGWHGETPFNAALGYGCTAWLAFCEASLLLCIRRKAAAPD